MLALYVLLVVLLVAYMLFRKSTKPKPQATFLEARDQLPPVITAANRGIAPRVPRTDWSEYDIPTFVRRKRTTE